MHTYDDLQKQRIDQLNQVIEVGLTQLELGHKISASESYQPHKKKIKKYSQGMNEYFLSHIAEQDIDEIVLSIAQENPETLFFKNSNH